MTCQGNVPRQGQDLNSSSHWATPIHLTKRKSFRHVFCFEVLFFPGLTAQLTRSLRFPNQELNLGHGYKPGTLTSRPPGNSPFDRNLSSAYTYKAQVLELWCYPWLMTVSRRKQSKRKRRANCESEGNKTAKGLEGGNKQGVLRKSREGQDVESGKQGHWMRLEQQKSSSPGRVLQPMTRCLALAELQAASEKLEGWSGLIRFSVLDYSGCFVENGLQSSKTECGETSQETITEGWGEMARGGTRTTALTVEVGREVLRK